MIYLAGSLARLDATLIETLCLVECLARIGVPAKDVRVVTDYCADPAPALLADRMKPNERAVFVIARQERPYGRLRLHGVEGAGAMTRECKLTIAVGPWTRGVDVFDHEWVHAWQTFGEAPREEAEPVLRASRARANLPTIEAMLSQRGFAFSGSRA